MFKSPLLNKVNFISHCFFGKENKYTNEISTHELSDNTYNLKNTYEQIKLEFNCKISNIYKLKQIHSNKLVNVSNSTSEDIKSIEGDGLITSTENQILSIVTADCMPLLFVNIKEQLIAAVHVGWKALLTKIIEKTILKLKDPKYIKVAIGPCIHQNSYQVDDNFRNIFLKDNHMYYDYFIKDTLSKDKNKYLFNMPLLAKHQLLCCDLLEKNIDVLPYDTYSNEHLFFSYRKSQHLKQPYYGLQMSCIQINESER